MIWVSGFKTTCDTGAGNSNCYYINKDEDVNTNNWEYFYSDIEGFVFEKGELKRIKILQQEQPANEQVADKSTLKYIFQEELDNQMDHRNSLEMDWELEQIPGVELNNNTQLPKLTFDLQEMKVFGNGGCNDFNGTISKVALKSLTLGNLLNTLKICDENNVEDTFFNALNKIAFYTIENKKLNLFDDQNKLLLTFKPFEKTQNKIRIHDIWAVIRVEGYPINRMVTVPRLEINTQDMKMMGNDGCNEYFSSIKELTDTKITIENIGSTRKICQEMEFPERYKNALKSIATYSFINDKLIFYNNSGDEVLAFMKVD